MKKLLLLDCTLRETPIEIYGAENIKKTIDNLEKSKIEIIECAFLTNLVSRNEAGSTHVNSIEVANKIIQAKKPGILYTACMNQGEFDVFSLPTYNKEGIDGIRYVLMEGRLQDAIDEMKHIKELGYLLMIQHRNIISYSDAEIRYAMKIANELGAFSYSIVDTFGSMYPEELKEICKIADTELVPDILLGFHGHNNHLLATSNAEEFIRIMKNSLRGIFVDGTIMGAGIGAGNANIELLALYCNQWYKKKYDIQFIYEIADTIIPKIEKRCVWGYSLLNLISGENNAVHLHAERVRSLFPNKSINEVNELIGKMPDELKFKTDMGYWYRLDVEDKSYKLKVVRYKIIVGLYGVSFIRKATNFKHRMGLQVIRLLNKKYRCE